MDKVTTVSMDKGEREVLDDLFRAHIVAIKEYDAKLMAWQGAGVSDVEPSLENADSTKQLLFESIHGLLNTAYKAGMSDALGLNYNRER